MELFEYKARYKISYTTLAKKLKCSRNHLNKIALKQLKPGKYLADKIEVITEGVVTAEELMKVYEEENKCKSCGSKME